MSDRKSGVALSSILNGYTKQRTKVQNQESQDDIQIDPELVKEAADLSSSFNPTNMVNLTLKQSESEKSVDKKPINLMNVLSGYSKKPKEMASAKSINDNNLIIVDDSPVKASHSQELHIIKESLPSARTSNIASFLQMDRKPIQRASIVSKEINIPAPFPSIQLTPSHKHYDFRSVSLRKRKVDMVTPDFEPNEYEFLNRKHSIKETTKTICIKEDTSNTELWNDLFKPEDYRDVLIDSNTISNIWNWFSSSFEKLKKKTDRSALYNRKDFDEMDCFVVDDGMYSSEGDEELTDFVPLLILYGGIGKNTLIEAIMARIDGQIFEINCSMNRAKKDISEILNEFATTKYVKDTQSLGIILFDDVDVLLTETDKFFWNSVYSTLLVTKRPVVITCRDYRHIPSNLLEIAERYNSIFKIESPSRDSLKLYLQRCMERKGVTVDEVALNSILDSYSGDIRKCIIELQWLCTQPATLTSTSHEKLDEAMDLNRKIEQADLLSSYDMIAENISGRSVFTEDMDMTLNYTGPHMRTGQDIDGPKNILWNYTEHIWDSNYNSLLPWEISIKDFAKSFDYISDSNEYFCNRTSLKFKTILVTMIRFLMTRVSTNQSENIIKRPTSTRSTRRKKSSLNDYRLKSEASFPVSGDFSDDELLREFLSTHSLNDTVTYVLPTVYEIAKNEKNIKRKNLALYSELKNSRGPDATSNEIINEMIQRRLLLPAFFRGASESFIDSYE